MRSVRSAGGTAAGRGESGPALAVLRRGTGRSPASRPAGGTYFDPIATLGTRGAGVAAGAGSSSLCGACKVATDGTEVGISIRAVEAAAGAACDLALGIGDRGAPA